MRVKFMIGAATTAVALAASPLAQAANQALFVNGMAGGLDLPDAVMAKVLDGQFSTYTRTNVHWPQQAAPFIGILPLAWSIDIGATNLVRAVKAAAKQTKPGESVYVVGLSAGALVANEAQRRLATDPGAPDATKLKFVVVGDSSRMPFNTNRYDALLNYKYVPPPVTRYDTTVVTAQYDGFADFPDQANLIAVANALAGMLTLHLPSMFADYGSTPSQSETTVNARGGRTTTYVLPAASLPLSQVVPILGLVEPVLRPIVEAGYTRRPARASAATASTDAVADSAAPAVKPSPVAAGVSSALTATKQDVTEASPGASGKPGQAGRAGQTKGAVAGRWRAGLAAASGKLRSAGRGGSAAGSDGGARSATSASATGG